jgi:bacilliredoxin
MIVQRYPEPFIAPMRAELSRLGFEDLTTPDAVDAAVKQPGTTMIVVNSVCGCAAGKARPGIALALSKGKRPDRLATAISTLIAVDRDHEGRQAGVHDGAPRD